MTATSIKGYSRRQRSRRCVIFHSTVMMLFMFVSSKTKLATAFRASSSHRRSTATTIHGWWRQHCVTRRPQLLSVVRHMSLSDESAVSKSRAPFSMPRNSPDDSKSLLSPQKGKKHSDLAWNQLGLWTELVDSVQELKLPAPTAVQSMAIPALLKQPPKGSNRPADLCFLAATGSGKTLAYALPLLQLLKQDEVFDDQQRNNTTDRPPRRPRLIILAPTRELVLQITAVVKQLTHHIKLSSTALVRGGDYGLQRRALNRPIDIVVATPGCLLQHWKGRNVFLNQVQHVVVDEMDTMLEQGFAGDLKALLYPILYYKQAEQKDVDAVRDLQPTAPRLVLTSATMTLAIQRMLGNVENEKTSSVVVTARKMFRKQSSSDNNNNDNSKMIMALPPMQILKAPGLHKTVPRLQQVFVDVGGTDKMALLIDILSSSKQDLCMVFCNTAVSCRAVHYPSQD